MSTIKRTTRQFVVFVLACGFAAVVNFGSRIYFSHYMSYASAIVLAYLVGMLTAFVLCKLFVFDAGKTGRSARELGVFTIVNIFAIIQTLAISLLLARIVFPAMGMYWHNETVAHAVGVAVPAVTSFIGHKYFSFAKPKGAK